jgi:hypothetical protein
MMEEKIDELVKRFTESWFEKKLNFFVNPSKGYDPETNTRLIKTAGFNSVFNEDTGETYSELAWEDIEEVTLGDFCWCDEERYYEQREFYPDEKLDPFDACSVVNEICDVVDSLIAENDVQTSFNIINSASLIFSEDMQTLIAKSKGNDKLEQVLLFIANKGTFHIRKKFERIVQQYIYGSKNNIQLDFELNKQQLAALLFLIEKAGMLTKKDRGVMKKYDFFEHFFFWTNASDDSVHKLSGLKKNFSEFKNGVRVNSVNEVFEMLKKANKNYIRTNW